MKTPVNGYLTSFPTVILAMTFFTASFFFSFLSLLSSAFNSNISPKGNQTIYEDTCSYVLKQLDLLQK